MMLADPERHRRNFWVRLPASIWGGLAPVAGSLVAELDF
jgi:hypothetical protein